MQAINFVATLIKKKWQVTGTVTDSETATPIAGATVSFDNGLTGQTDASGVIVLSPFLRGDYQYSIIHADYEDFTDILEVT